MIEQKEEVKKLCDYCIQKGEAICSVKVTHQFMIYVDFEKFTEFRYNCKLLLSLIEDPYNVCNDLCNSGETYLKNAQSMLACLRSLKYAIENDYVSFKQNNE